MAQHCWPVCIYLHCWAQQSRHQRRRSTAQEEHHAGLLQVRVCIAAFLGDALPLMLSQKRGCRLSPQNMMTLKFSDTRTECAVML